MTDKIFPLIDVSQVDTVDGIRYTYATNIRKQAGGIWFKSLITQNGIITFEKDLRKASSQLSQKFLINVYNYMINAMVNTDLETIDGYKLWVKDDNQESEAVRMKKLTTI